MSSSTSKANAARIEPATDGFTSERERKNDGAQADCGAEAAECAAGAAEIDPRIKGVPEVLRAVGEGASAGDTDHTAIGRQVTELGRLREMGAEP